MLIWGTLPAQGANRYPSVRLVPWETLKRKPKSIQKIYVDDVRFSVMMLEEEMMGDSSFADEKYTPKDLQKNQIVWNLFLQKAFAEDEKCLIGGAEQERNGKKCSTRGRECDLAGSKDNFKCGPIFSEVCISRTPPNTISKRCYVESGKQGKLLGVADYKKFESEINSIYDSHCSGKEHKIYCKLFQKRLQRYKDMYGKTETKPAPAEPERPAAPAAPAAAADKPEDKAAEKPANDAAAPTVAPPPPGPAPVADAAKPVPVAPAEAPAAAPAPPVEAPKAEAKPEAKEACKVDESRLKELKSKKNQCMPNEAQKEEAAYQIAIKTNQLAQWGSIVGRSKVVSSKEFQSKFENTKQILPDVYDLMAEMMATPDNHLSGIGYSSNSGPDSQCPLKMDQILNSLSKQPPTISYYTDKNDYKSLNFPPYKIIQKDPKVNKDALMEKVIAFKEQAGINCQPPSLMATAQKAKELFQKQDGQK